MFSDDLHEKVALVMETDTALGRAIALRLSRDGAIVALGYHQDTQAVSQAVAAIDREGGRAVAIRTDVQQPESRQQLFDLVLARFQRMDFVIVNTSLPLGKPIAQTSDAEFEELVLTHLRSALPLCREVESRLTEGGHVLHISVLAPFLETVTDKSRSDPLIEEHDRAGKE
jgi:3-oxoacyl-[acyl-carrier protein] reductase